MCLFDLELNCVEFQSACHGKKKSALNLNLFVLNTKIMFYELLVASIMRQPVLARA